MTLSANFLRPCFATDEYLTVTGTVIRYGKRSAVVEVKIVRPKCQETSRAPVMNLQEEK